MMTTAARQYEFDAPVILAALLQDMIGAIELTPVREQQAMIEAAVADHGGYISAPQARPGGWGPHQWEVGLLGLMGMGEDFPSALRNWTKCAGRTLTEGAAG